MSYEVDIIHTEGSSQSSDAIALRFGNFKENPADQTVVVIDGGFVSSGEKLVQRIKNEYGTDHVHLVISTHPDADHINGLRIILEELEVDELWMHTPWNVSDSLKFLAENRGEFGVGSSNALKKSLEAAYDLEQLALEKGVKVVEPFEGLSFKNSLYVLGPSLDYYFELVSEFDGSVGDVASFFQKTKNTITELWHKDELMEPEENAVTARNNSSVITVAQLGSNFLFVGDAGVSALTRAADHADSKGYDLSVNINYYQVPHHGSKRNIGPKLLDRIIGPVLLQDQKNGKTAFISASIGDSKHPSPRVTNALNRRGAKVTSTSTTGNDQYFRSLDLQMRPNWVPVPSVEFIYSYEEEE